MSSDADHSYRVGRSGGSIGSASDALAWAVGDQERRNQETLSAGIQGEEHPNGFAIVVLMFVTGAPVGFLSYNQWFFWGSYVDWEPWGHIISAAVWAVGTSLIYHLLRWLPDWLSGLLMGSSLGGLAAYIGWTEGGLEYAAWAGGIVGAIAFLLFYFLD